MEMVIYILLGITSVVAVTFIIERGIALRRARVVPVEIENALNEFLLTADVGPLRRACEHKPSAVSRLLLTAAAHEDWPKAENEDAVQTRARHEVVRLERGLVVLEIIVGIAPLLGLVGTILGMMEVFADVGQAGLQDAGKLASGIALILRATLLGLLIAIPALVFWSYYSKKVETLTVQMETLCSEFVRRLYREK